MRKIISLFQRNYDGDRLVRDEVVPGAEWVIASEGIATRKFDGTCCMIKGGVFYKRYDVKKGRVPPDGFIPAQEPDAVTGHWPGWLQIQLTDTVDRWHCEAFFTRGDWPDGTYELCGPKINNNPERQEKHVLIPHGQEIVDAPRTFNALKEWFADKDIEGIVWHHSDGRMVKIKKRDFFGRR